MKCTILNCNSMTEDEIDDSLITFSESLSSTKNLKKEGTLIIEHVDRLTLLQQKILLEVCQIQTNLKQNQEHFIRLIALTSNNIELVIMNNLFNEELYYLMNKMSIRLPNLQERAKDLPILAKRIVNRLNFKLGMKITTIETDAISLLLEVSRERNLFQFEHAIEQIMLSEPISIKKITKESIERASNVLLRESTKLNGFSIENSLTNSLQDSLDEFEKDMIEKMFNKYFQNKIKTAKALNISIRNLYYKLEKYSIL